MPLIFRICDTGYFCESYSVMACSMVSLLTFGWPPFLPRALAAFSPARVRSTISSLSNWLTPLKMVKRSLPWGVVVSSHGSFKDFMFAPALSIFSTRSKRSLTERLSRVISQMMMVSPFLRVRRRMESSGQDAQFMNDGIEVVLREDLHILAAVIDRRILWYGNINFTGGNYPDDNTMRIIEPAIASEIMGYLMEGE